MKVIGLFFALLLVSAAPLFAAPATMQDGNWEITMKMDMAGMPFALPPMVTTHCYTKEDINDSKKTIPSTSQKNDCEKKDVTVVGNKVTWKMQCKDGSTGSGEMEYKQTSYSGMMTLEKADKKGGTSKIIYHMSGKRIGDCK
ncbi:MAG TPA: DUF3617 family protein [Nitrospirota bacterium]|jgi:hypothetical protein|nr:DUF3617 family protein [Nitrospirota bacterium]